MHTSAELAIESPPACALARLEPAAHEWDWKQLETAERVFASRSGFQPRFLRFATSIDRVDVALKPLDTRVNLPQGGKGPSIDQQFVQGVQNLVRAFAQHGVATARKGNEPGVGDM